MQNNDAQTIIGREASIPRLGYLHCIVKNHLPIDKQAYCFVWCNWLTAGLIELSDHFPYPFYYAYMLVDLDEFAFDDRAVKLTFSSGYNTVNFYGDDRIGSTFRIPAPVNAFINGVELEPVYPTRAKYALEDAAIANQYERDQLKNYMAAGYTINPQIKPCEWIVIEDKQYPLFSLTNTEPVIYTDADYEADYTRARYWLPVWLRQVERHAKKACMNNQSAIEIAAAEYLESFRYRDALKRDVPMVRHTRERLHRYLYEVFVASAGGSIG